MPVGFRFVPVDFLSDEQVATYARFTGVPGRAELERFFFLDDLDRELVAKRRGDHNRLGFAVQLGTVRYLGTFLTDPLDVPWPVVDYLAVQLGVEDASVVKRYTDRHTLGRYAFTPRPDAALRSLRDPNAGDEI